MKQFITAVCLLLSSLIFGQSHVYRFQIDVIDDPDRIKQVSSVLTNIFDVAPDYDPEQNMFRVVSEVTVDEGIFLNKLLRHGFTLLLFSREEYISVKPDTK